MGTKTEAKSRKERQTRFPVFIFVVTPLLLNAAMKKTDETN